MHRVRLFAVGAAAIALGALGLAATTTSALPAGASPAATAALPGSATIHTVFQILLENESESATFPGTGTELDHLSQQGVFFKNYFATGHASLDNYVALVSGQAQFSSTSQDCPFYHDAGGTVDSRGFYQPLMPEDVGCVFPTSVKTLADQLAAAKISWRGYMQDMGNTPTRETEPCGQPAVAGIAVNPTIGFVDQTELATPTDQYAARHNPFPYFHSLINAPLFGTSPCQQHVVPLSHLAGDLAAGHVGAWNFITPNLCNDGHDSPCKGPGAGGLNPGIGGLVSANAFLSKIVPVIEASSEFQNGGLIVITVDEGGGNESCCGESGSPGLQPSGGGGKVGLVAIGPGVTPHVSTCGYNHYSLLRAWEDLFGLTAAKTHIPGSDGLGHLAHAGDAGVTSMLSDLGATANPCA